mmetsp:Transcript_28845/g.40617  ORF Transcript_28845/g.40617 Transcript_28845/m.40617 type:complete len:211 (-) Transcript_28845:568-1200(-)
MSTEYDFLFKILVVGESAVGKSSLLLRFADDTFTEEFITTIGVDFKFRTLKIDDSIVKLQIWDTAGQERFRTLTSAYYRGANGVMLAFDVTDLNSFKTVEKWISDIRVYSPDQTPIVLVATKADLTNKRVVDADAAKQLAEKYGFKYFETSSKTGLGVNDSFFSLTSEILKKAKERKASGQRDPSQQKTLKKVELSPPQEEEESSCCTII